MSEYFSAQVPYFLLALDGDIENFEVLELLVFIDGAGYKQRICLII